jgi:hypothetical protein
LSADRHRVVASVALRGTGAFCPVCERQLLVRIPSLRVAHFAHPPRSGCDGGAAVRLAHAVVRRATLARRRAEQVELEGQQVLFTL